MKTEKFLADIEKLGFEPSWIESDVFIKTNQKESFEAPFIAIVSSKYPFSFSLTEYRFYAIEKPARKKLLSLIMRYTENPNDRWEFDCIKEWREKT